MKPSSCNPAWNYNNQLNSQGFRFELTVEGMTCVKCTSKVEKILKEMETPIGNIKIDFITNRILLTLQNKDDIHAIITRIGEIGYRVSDSKDITQTISNSTRILSIKITKGEKETIKKILYNKDDFCLEGEPAFHGNKCSISYNPINLRGSNIVKKLQDSPEFLEGVFLFTIENPFVEDIKQIKFNDFGSKQLITVLIINFFNIILSFMPEEYMAIPSSFGMFSYYLVAVLILTILNMKFVGFEVYSTSIKQLVASFNINMMTLVSFGSGLSLIFGFIYFFLGLSRWFMNGNKGLHMFIMNAGHMFHTSAAIFTALVVGKFVEGKIKKRIFSKIDDLKNQLQVKIHSVRRIILKNKMFEILSTEDLAPLLIEKDDYIQVQTGMIPFDGFIEKGILKVVENVQYGWEKVEKKTKGHPIISGTQIIEAEEGTIMRVTEPLEKTLAGRLFYEIKEAASGSSSDQKKGNDILASITKYFIAIVLMVALVTFLGWTYKLFTDPGSVPYSYPFEKVIAVVVASCPCALGIAIPMVYAISLRKGFKSGALIKDTASLDTLQTIDTVIFDKTGTITGTYNIKETKNFTKKYDDATLWEIVSILEKEHLQHPVGLALFQEALQRLSNFEEMKHVIARNEHNNTSRSYFASEGVIDKEILIDNKVVHVALGNEKLLSRLQIKTSTSNHLVIDFDNNDIDHIYSDLSSSPTPKLPEKKTEDPSETSLYLCIENQIEFEIVLSLEENFKRNVDEVISSLKLFKKDLFILSGDNKANANQIGQKFGIPLSNIYGDMDPEGKAAFITNLREKEKRKVMMIGDGINDIKAFNAADLSCSINFKSSQNLTFSDFIIINNSLETLLYLFNLAVITGKFKKIILICSLIYNVPVILAASGALKHAFGIDLEAYFACWTMVLFSSFLAITANLMELINIKHSPTQQSRFPTFLELVTAILNVLRNKEKKGIGKTYFEKVPEENNTGGSFQRGIQV